MSVSEIITELSATKVENDYNQVYKLRMEIIP